MAISECIEVRSRGAYETCKYAQSAHALEFFYEE